MEGNVLNRGLASHQWIRLIDLRSNERFEKVKENRRVSTVEVCSGLICRSLIHGSYYLRRKGAEFGEEEIKDPNLR